MKNDTSWKTRCIHDGTGIRISQIPLAKDAGRIDRILSAAPTVQGPSFEEDLKSKITPEVIAACVAMVALVVWVLVAL